MSYIASFGSLPRPRGEYSYTFISDTFVLGDEKVDFYKDDDGSFGAEIRNFAVGQDKIQVNDVSAITLETIPTSPTFPESTLVSTGGTISPIGIALVVGVTEDQLTTSIVEA